MAGEGGHRTYEYELDPAGNRLSVTDKDSKYIKFGLDPKYQLTNETQWSAKTPGTRNLQYAYVMDPNGNRLLQHKDGVVTSYTIGDNNEVTNISGIGAIDYDHYGSVVAYSDVTLTYDFERHMTHIEDESNHTDDHEYDGNGRRMRSKLNGAANWTHFIHDELTEQILSEYTLVSSTFTVKSANTYGIGLISTNRESTKRYFHFDGLGSTRALTDSSQVVQDTYEFSAYGIQESSTGSSVNPYRFVGQRGYYDDGARGSTFELLLLGIRYYKPSWGRFLVWDILRSGPNYAYCGNSPTRLTDADGRYPCIEGDECWVACRWFCILKGEHLLYCGEGKWYSGGYEITICDCQCYIIVSDPRPLPWLQRIWPTIRYPCALFCGAYCVGTAIIPGLPPNGDPNCYSECLTWAPALGLCD